jgi:DNA-binding HxlR family transcriptional regulator
MRQTLLADSSCPLTRSLHLLGDRWTLLILREAFAGTRRFEGFRERLGIARNILSGRLRVLVEGGIFERTLYQVHPNRYEYRLTERGVDLYELLVSLRRWGERWLMDGDPPARPLVHEKCGTECNAVHVCSECGAEISPSDLTQLLRSESIGSVSG